MKLRNLCLPLALIAMSAVNRQSLADDVAVKQLVAVNTADAVQRFVTKNNQVTIAPGTTAPGIEVTIQPGKDPYPGVALKPESGATMDLSAFGHVDAKITNLGDKPLIMILQIDNAGDWRNAPWNAENQTIKPGATGTATVYFGYGYGRKLGYALKSAEVSQIQVLAFKSDAVQSFRIDSITASGANGEKPPVDPNSIRTKPKDGVVFGAGVPLNAAKQIDAQGGAKAVLDGSALKVQLASEKADEAVLLKPAIGRWDFGESSQVRIKIKNTGSAPITPAVQLTSDKLNTTAAIASAEPIAPGQSQEIVVPFMAAKTWIGAPSATIFKGDVSGGTGAPNYQPGTGTQYASDRTDGIKITAKHDGAATLLIESITAEAPSSDVPDWLGQRPPVEGEWTKTFDDGFDGKEIDLTKWNNEGPNYWDKISHWSKANLVLDGKTVSLHYEKKTGNQNDDPKGKQTDFTGGYLDTYAKWRQRYGYFEARLKLPTANGLWPAFWMMPDRGPATPDAPGSRKNRCTTSNGAMEFDIMEQLTIWGNRRYNVAMHWDDYGPQHKSIGTGKVYFQPDKDGFITTGLLWTPGLTVYYCNGQEIARWEDPRISNVPAYLIVYMPTGGWDNNNLDPSKLPDDLVVDYVRCWQRKDLAAPLDGDPPAEAK